MNLFLKKDNNTHAIKIYNKGGDLLGEALFDSDLLPVIEKHKWYISSHGYSFTTFIVEDERKWVSLHRFVYGIDHQIEYGNRKYHIDHKDRVKLNCRRSNLRKITPLQNMQNKSTVGFKNRKGKKTSSKYRGVYKVKEGRWRGQVQVHGKLHHIGYYPSEILAATACGKFRQHHMTHSKN